jgi:TolB protein
MQVKRQAFLFLAVFSANLISAQKPETAPEPKIDESTHLKNIRQLTFGGDNAEAYWSPDSKSLTFQSNYKKWGLECDQIFRFDVKKGANNPEYRPKPVSTMKGRTTCSFFMPNGKDILYASTHEGGEACPHTPNLREGGKYLWPIFDTYDIYVANKKGKVIKKLTDTKGYDAEAVVSPKGDKIVFTSDRSGDLELWIMDIDGSNQKQITTELGYDGGAFFPPMANNWCSAPVAPKPKPKLRSTKTIWPKVWSLLRTWKFTPLTWTVPISNKLPTSEKPTGHRISTLPAKKLFFRVTTNPCAATISSCT